jgi:HEAT repeat protein
MADKRSWRGTRLCRGLGLAAMSALIISVSAFGAPAPAPSPAMGSSPAMAEVRKLQYEVIKEKTLPPAQMAQLRRLASDTNPFVRARALSALGGLGQSKQSREAAAIAKSKLADTEPLVRGYALGALQRLKAPDLIAEAQKMTQDPDPNVRKRAAEIVHAHH